MKATGIVRRIDDLGRIVVPKEIRRTLRIREGDPLEIFTDREGEIILKKYSPIGELSQFAGEYAESLAQASGLLVCIADRDEIIAAAGRRKKEYEGKRPSSQLDRIMENRMCGNFSKNDENLIQITSDDTCDYYGQTIATIVNDGDCAGAVVMCAGEEKEFQGEVAGKLVKTAADFLSKQIG